jgi:hypothetical protein
MSIGLCSDEKLNELGKDNWELTTSANNGQKYVFKRPKRPKTSPDYGYSR